MIWELKVHFASSRIWILLLTGDLRHIWQTCRSTMSTRQTASDSTDAIKGTYLDNYKQILDLYITDSTCEPTMLSSKTGEDAASEFALGEAVFYQNGTWAYSDITGQRSSR